MVLLFNLDLYPSGEPVEVAGARTEGENAGGAGVARAAEEALPRQRRRRPVPAAQQAQARTAAQAAARTGNGTAKNSDALFTQCCLEFSDQSSADVQAFQGTTVLTPDCVADQTTQSSSTPRKSDQQKIENRAMRDFNSASSSQCCQLRCCVLCHIGLQAQSLWCSE